MEYSETVKRIREIEAGGDMFKTILQLGDLATSLAAENYRLQMTVAMLQERKDYNPYLADERQEGMRL